MKKLSSIPPPANRTFLNAITIPQLRVLRALAPCRGPISRNEVSRRAGVSTVCIGRAIGYSDPEKRNKLEQSKDGGYRPSLLTLLFVTEKELDIDGVKETVLEITDLGRKAVEAQSAVVLPPFRREQEEAEEGRLAGS